MQDYTGGLADRLRRFVVRAMAAFDRVDAPPREPDDPGGPRQAGRSRAELRLDLDRVVGDCRVYAAGRREEGQLSLRQAGEAVHRGRGFVWIALLQPSEHDVAAVAQQFRLPALAVDDAVRAHQRPKLEVYGDLVFAVVKPVHYIDHDEVVEVSEFAAFLGPNFVVTVQHGDTDILRQVRAELADGDPAVLALGPTGVLYRAADLVVDGYEAAATSINDDVDDIESQVFAAEQTQDLAERIYKLKREVAEFRRAVLPLAAPMKRLADSEIPEVDPQASPFFRDVHDHLLRAADTIEGHDRLLSDVLQANLARVSARQATISLRQNEIAVRQNEDMRRISAWAAIALVPTAVAGIYGMNFDNMPELHWQYGYFIAITVIAAACVGLHRLFRRNGWL